MLQYSYGDNSSNIALLIDELQSHTNDPKIVIKAADEVSGNYRYAHLLDQKS